MFPGTANVPGTLFGQQKLTDVKEPLVCKYGKGRFSEQLMLKIDFF
jgi:hypothetical protein